jgi:DNA-binding NarL/FixJ family response regulator
MSSPHCTRAPAASSSRTPRHRPAGRDPGGRRRRRPARPAAAPDQLTEREREILALVGLGLCNTEIASHLHVSLSTTKTHVGRLLMKLRARDRAPLVIAAYETGLARPP